MYMLHKAAVKEKYSSFFHYLLVHLKPLSTDEK